LRSALQRGTFARHSQKALHAFVEGGIKALVIAIAPCPAATRLSTGRIRRNALAVQVDRDGGRSAAPLRSQVRRWFAKGSSQIAAFLISGANGWTGAMGSRCDAANL
jgi:hypothetical protein